MKQFITAIEQIVSGVHAEDGKKLLESEFGTIDYLNMGIGIRSKGILDKNLTTDINYSYVLAGTDRVKIKTYLIFKLFLVKSNCLIIKQNKSHIVYGINKDFINKMITFLNYDKTLTIDEEYSIVADKLISQLKIIQQIFTEQENEKLDDIWVIVLDNTILNDEINLDYANSLELFILHLEIAYRIIYNHRFDYTKNNMNAIASNILSNATILDNLPKLCWMSDSAFEYQFIINKLDELILKRGTVEIDSYLPINKKYEYMYKWLLRNSMDSYMIESIFDKYNKYHNDLILFENMIK